MKWIFLAFLLIANCGFWLFCFNQINATGLPRKTVKKVEKSFILLCFLIPTLVFMLEGQVIYLWLTQNTQPTGWRGLWPQASLFRVYGAWCFASGIVLGFGWLKSQLGWIPPQQLQQEQQENFAAHAEVTGGSPGDRLTSFLQRVPGNQIGELQVTHKALQIGRSIPGIEELRIGHISDLHLTGQYRKAHYQYVLEKFQHLEPNIAFITGDIIDKDAYLEWIPEIFSLLNPKYGAYFVLGNHDLRVRDQQRLLNELDSAGLIDVGIADQRLTLSSGTQVVLKGNEHPWYERHIEPQGATDAKTDFASNQELRIGLAHSPDQHRWAQQQRLDLLLAGHTHGGQVRVPMIGPLVSPSIYGSRFASGVFHLSPTLMHVSRGVAGTHPLRWWCRPEISLLTLSCEES